MHQRAQHLVGGVPCLLRFCPLGDVDYDRGNATVGGVGMHFERTSALSNGDLKVCGLPIPHDVFELRLEFGVEQYWKNLPDILSDQLFAGSAREFDDTAVHVDEAPVPID